MFVVTNIYMYIVFFLSGVKIQIPSLIVRSPFQLNAQLTTQIPSKIHAAGGKSFRCLFHFM